MKNKIKMKKEIMKTLSRPEFNKLSNIDKLVYKTWEYFKDELGTEMVYNDPVLVAIRESNNINEAYEALDDLLCQALQAMALVKNYLPKQINFK